MKRIAFSCLLFLLAFSLGAQKHISIAHPESWTTADMSAYVGQEVIFDDPLIICSNVSNYSFNGTVKVSPRRTYAPTNQARPRTQAYNSVVSLNQSGTLSLSGVGEYHRAGERVYNLRAYVRNKTTLEFRSGDWHGNSRADLLAGIPVDELGDYSLLICTMNLEYYLAAGTSSEGMGPASKQEHQKQRTKTSKALAHIAADIFGFIEIESGDEALREIAEDLTANTGRPYTFISDGSSPNGSYTKAGYVYCTQTVDTLGKLQSNGTLVSGRGKMQCFVERATGEKFLFSVNHFKAKSGTGSGADADQGDGQGKFNARRVKEAESVIQQYNRFRTQVRDKDVLIMGDLNAYGMEDPIYTFIQSGFTDLHRHCHADSSYSYMFAGQAGYLDHAIVNTTLLQQVTGMVAFHINSDESDEFTYDKSSDQSMFRCSDHDPVLVGLRLENIPDYSADPFINAGDFGQGGINIYNIYDPEHPLSAAYFAVHTLSGHCVCPPTPIRFAQGEYQPGVVFSLSPDNSNLPATAQDQLRSMHSGAYIITIYARGGVFSHKLILP